MVIRLIITTIFFSFPAILLANDTITSDIKIFKHNTEIQFSDIELWQRQLLTIKINFTTEEEFSYVSLDKTQDQSFLFKYTIQENETLARQSTFNKSLVLYFWPLQDGLQRLNIPVVHLKLSGRSIKELALPPVDILVKPLPAYLPPGFPVGNIKIKNEYSGNSFFPFFFTPGKLASYQLTVTTSGLDESFVPDYSNYLQSSEISRLASDKNLISTVYNNEYVITKHLTIPMVINTNGLIHFNSFKVFSFDPETAKVISYHYHPDTLLALNIPAQFLLTTVIVIFLYFLTQYFIRYIQYILSRRRQWQLIQQSCDALQLSFALKRLLNQGNKSLLPYDSKQSNISLKKWSENWNSSELTKLVTGLNELVFSEQSNLDFPSLKQDIVTTLRKHENVIYYCYTGKITA